MVLMSVRDTALIFFIFSFLLCASATGSTCLSLFLCFPPFFFLSCISRMYLTHSNFSSYQVHIGSVLLKSSIGFRAKAPLNLVFLVLKGGNKEHRAAL